MGWCRAWSIPGTTPWYGSGPHFPTVSPLFPHCGTTWTHFDPFGPHFDPFWTQFWPILASFWPNFSLILAKNDHFSDTFSTIFREFPEIYPFWTLFSGFEWSIERVVPNPYPIRLKSAENDEIYLKLHEVQWCQKCQFHEKPLGLDRGFRHFAKKWKITVFHVFLILTKMARIRGPKWTTQFLQNRLKSAKLTVFKAGSTQKWRKSLFLTKITVFRHFFDHFHCF